jgi:hypothetical protein
MSRSCIASWASGAMRLTTVSQGCHFVASDQHRIGRDLERGDAEPVEMGQPRRLVGEALGLMLREQPDDRAGERPVAHIGERLGVDDVIAMAGAQQFQEIEPALRAGGAEPGEAVVADLRAVPVPGLVAGPGVPPSALPKGPSTVTQGAVASPARSTSCASTRKRSWRSISRRTTCRFETAMPIASSMAVSRGTVTCP